MKGKGARGRTLCVWEVGRETLNKLELSLLHINGVVLSLSFPPSPEIPRACEPRCIKTFANGSHGGLSAQRVNCSLITVHVFRFAVHNCLNTVFLVNEVKKNKTNVKAGANIFVNELFSVVSLQSGQNSLCISWA